MPAGSDEPNAEGLGALPFAYATALRMTAAGMDAAAVAVALGIEVEGVSPLLALARAKLLSSAKPETHIGDLV